MKKHPYFEHSIRGHHVTEEQVGKALENEVERMVQEDGRIRIWGCVAERNKYLALSCYRMA